MKILENYSLKTLNTFGLEAKARYFCTLATLGGIRTLLQWRQEHPDLPVLLLGGGSNLLFIADYPGLVVKVALRERTFLGEDSQAVYLRAGAGENWHQWVRWTIDQGYAGLENLSLIPGTVGAAPMQNIGAYGIELKDCFHELLALDWQTAELRAFGLEDCQFGYRDSYFKSVEPDRWLIASVTFRLPRQTQWRLDYAGIREALAEQSPPTLNARAVSDAIMKVRQSKLPDPAVLGNAGSFFKNPLVTAEQFASLQRDFPTLTGWPQVNGLVKLSAGWLIDQAGWKGKRSGQVGTYEQHALVLVNYGGATGVELWQLAQSIRQSVYQQFGVQLEPEPRVVG